MAIKTFKINCWNGGGSSSGGLAGFNEIGDSYNVAEVKFPNLLDENGDPTGFSLEQLVAFENKMASSGYATSSPEPAVFPVWFFRGIHFTSGISKTDFYKISGLPPGASFSLRPSGQSLSDSIITTYYATGASGSAPYANSGTNIDPVAAPPELTGEVPNDGVVIISAESSEVRTVFNGFLFSVEESAGPSITTADNVTTEGQTATFTLSGNTGAPTGATLNGTDVGSLTDQGSGVYSYTAPLIADDDTADLVVSVDGTTAGATIAYANSYDRDQLTHPATEAEYSENSLSYPNAYATTQAYEWKVIADANASVVTIDWNALEADDGFHKNIASYATPVANGSTTVRLGVFVPETGQAYQFDRTITVSDGSVVVEGEGLFRSLFSALEKPLFKPLFR